MAIPLPESMQLSARLGFFPIEAALATFRKARSPFEGHVEKGIPGVEWNTGNLGQGLSAGCGFALGSKILEKDFHVFVAMGCGEQQKGQISEARRFAVKYGLSNLTVIIDFNCRQISGVTQEIMPQNISRNFESDGWRAIEVEGHQFQEIYTCLPGSDPLQASHCNYCPHHYGKRGFFHGRKRRIPWKGPHPSGI